MPVSSLADLACTHLSGVGPRLMQRLQKLDIYSVQDLLFHLPMRYQDRTRMTAIKDARPGDHAMVEGHIIETKVKAGRRPSFLVVIQDQWSVLNLRFFHFSLAQQTSLARIGLRLRCFGEVRWGPTGLEMVHPEYTFVDSDHPTPIDETLTPVYPTTEGLSQNIFRKLIAQALMLIEKGHALTEYLPANILQTFQFPNLLDALIYIHRPPADAPQTQLENGTHASQRRLVFEELLAHQLTLRRLRSQTQQQMAPALSRSVQIIDTFIQNLPFTLTAAQQRVLNEIAADLTLQRPMLRLLQGDVGSGKTIIAACAIVQAIANGQQAALMAPTEILAEQHLKNFTHWLAPLNVHIAWLSGSLKNSIRNKMLEEIRSGQAQVVIGTHALFQKNVEFARLGLIVVDEQHRFGVDQRLELLKKGSQGQCFPHQLTMTATPIPRSLAMLAYADFDCSEINELPPGRIPVNTLVVSNQRRQEVVNYVNKICATGQQAYWVCTLIEESELLQCQAAEVTAMELSQILNNLKLGLIHGRMKPQDKENTMQAFKKGEIQLLVATTVIEVGVDVPNASAMVIENAERLGLAQLHQLRGRVGRGKNASHCILMYQAPLSTFAKQRLHVLREHHDGFIIAQQDLELRGSGEVLGTRQAGLMRFKIADLQRDKSLLPAIQKTADLLLQDHNECVLHLINRWIGSGERYGNV